MICRHCGAAIPDDQMVCPRCGAEVQIVPDYNPLDDVLAREVKGSVEGATRQIQTDDIRRYRRGGRDQNVNATRVLSQDEMDRIRKDRRYGGRQTDPGRRNTDELRRQRQQKRLEAAKRKRRNLLITLFVILALIVAGVVIVYQNSYTGMIRKGYNAIQTRDYTAAERYFERAIIKDKSRPEAYVGQAEIYIDQDDLDSAEEVFQDAIQTQPSNVKLYQAAIDFYMDTEQAAKISELLQDCEDETVLDAVADYISSAPEFSPEEGTFEEVQEITLTSETGGDIYYTLDGSDPSAESGTKYTEPILLQDEGEFEIRAVAVNARGIPSVVSSGTYVIQFPIVDAPAVTPSTGQYSQPQQITITVPDGYTAYYTMDGTTPTASSTRYTGPVMMPENAQTIFMAVLVNDNNGKTTEATTRNYITLSE
ncbi:MAG TPA: chitobiase/beta-hexosaminidase C-terminal domain-containing protein [Candidatus Mediterraneibacter caccavium]|uniref:Chitobiase/beta-hexosaminidase C-terminal domain-containing protein n=1 Tax=Candidatus Mediterraneibacter caccavium TaxID=2838661 RepID=A0A9D1VXZ1_9FIRM|nr:chitobiase/beta-hexosaminidase C-terminal domain-containing protein [Candidatus Mediterraneibacter caccavium]